MNVTPGVHNSDTTPPNGTIRYNIPQNPSMMTKLGVRIEHFKVG